MCEGYVEKPLYLLIAEWMMAENRWVIAREISIHFDIEHSKAVNTLTYILSEVTEISCEVKMIPNKLEGVAPHPARSPFRRHIRRPLQTGAIFLHLPQWLCFM